MEMLIADDDALYRRLLTSFAKDLHYRPLLAADGEQAWQLYQEHQPSFVILDWMMPHRTGVELCRSIRAFDAKHRPYIILVTTLSESERILEGFQCGADDYVAKPFDRRIFASRVRVASERVQTALEREEALHRDVVTRFQASVGHESPDLLNSLDALTNIYKQRRVFSKARAFLRRQIDISTRAGDDAVLVRLNAALRDINRQEEESAIGEETEAATV